MKREIAFKQIFLLLITIVLLVLNTYSLAENRDIWQKPYKVLEVIGVKPGMIIGEPGSGDGYFTFKLAEKVGPSGKIYANDIIQKHLESIKKKSKEEGFSNIITIKGKVENPLFPEGELDMIFMSYVLHDLTKPRAFLNNLKPSLKPNSPLVILERSPEKTKKYTGHFWKREKILKILKDVGFKLERIETFLPRDNIYIYFLK